MPELRTPSEAGAEGDGGMAPTVTATLEDGPMEGRSIEAELVEGRPPKTIDLLHEGSTCRYCLAEWVQSGGSAAYTFVSRV